MCFGAIPRVSVKSKRLLLDWNVSAQDSSYFIAQHHLYAGSTSEKKKAHSAGDVNAWYEKHREAHNWGIPSDKA